MMWCERKYIEETVTGLIMAMGGTAILVSMCVLITPKDASSSEKNALNASEVTFYTNTVLYMTNITVPEIYATNFYITNIHATNMWFALPCITNSYEPSVVYLTNYYTLPSTTTATMTNWVTRTNNVWSLAWQASAPWPVIQWGWSEVKPRWRIALWLAAAGATTLWWRRENRKTRKLEMESV